MLTKLTCKLNFPRRQIYVLEKNTAMFPQEPPWGGHEHRSGGKKGGTQVLIFGQITNFALVGF